MKAGTFLPGMVVNTSNYIYEFLTTDASVVIFKGYVLRIFCE